MPVLRRKQASESKSSGVENGAVEVPERPGLGADPEAEMIERYKV
jgi:L-alanine-DL-glutamate epimerase-like enolase superfamily enzyme